MRKLGCALAVFVIGACGDSDSKPARRSKSVIGQVTTKPTTDEVPVLPKLHSATPLSGAPGTVVLLKGRFFGAAQGSSTVTFGGYLAPVLSWSNESIQVSVPAFAPTARVPLVVSIAGQVGVPLSFMVTRTSAVFLENQKAGDADWPILNPGNVAAYAVPEAVRAGETVRLHVHAQTAGPAQYRLYRMGYYGGRGARLITTGTFHASAQPTPLADTATGLIECNWPAAATIHTSATWVSGYYLAKVKSAGGAEQYAAFTLVSNERPAILVSLPTATYQAYNYYGGMSLYVNQHPERFANHDHAVMVSFLRPYVLDGGAGEFLRRDHDGVKWLESAGYDLGYVSNVYAALHPEMLLHSALYLSVGHDEYWPDTLRAGMENARDLGMGLFFMGGNVGLWQTRLAPSQGIEGARMIGYKEYWEQDPLLASDPSRVTGQFRAAPVNRPENALLGVMWDCCGIASTVFRPHPTGDSMWAGTQWDARSTVARVVGGEFDRRFDNGHEPAGIEVLATSPVAGPGTLLSVSQATRYRAPSGAYVIATGSMDWQLGLGRDGEASSSFQKFNANLLNAVDPARGNIHPTAIAARPVFDVPMLMNTTVSTVAGSGLAGFGDGGLDVAAFHEPRALAFAPGGGLYVVDARNAALRLIKNGAVSTVATNLRFPNGVTVFADGMVYVSDAWAHGIWRIDALAKTKTLFAGGGSVSRDGAGAAAGFANLNPLIGSWSENVLYALDLPAGVRKIDRLGTVSTAFATELQGWGLARAPGGFWVADPNRMRISGLGVAHLAGNGDYGVRDGAAAQAAFGAPGDMALSADGSLFVADAALGNIRRIRAGQVASLTLGGNGYADGAGDVALFSSPMGMAYDATLKRLYVADAGNHRIRVVQLP